MSFVSILSEGPHPVGEIKSTNEVQEFVDVMSKEWDEGKVTTNQSFWKNWLGFSKTSMVNVTKFLIYCLDGLIILVDKLIDGGPDKKATVLFAIANLYDHIAKDALPFLAKPWAGGIKAFIVYTVISLAIDFIVSKYKEGTWRPN